MKPQPNFHILNRITANIFGMEFSIHAWKDKKHPRTGRHYLQASYLAPCTKTGEVQMWTGRKWYLSDYMTEDEIVKTAYCAFEAAVKHEIMEGFKVDGKILFNPHINFEKLLLISDKEITRS